jgi:hypothetical protein
MRKGNFQIDEKEMSFLIFKSSTTINMDTQGPIEINIFLNYEKYVD